MNEAARELPRYKCHKIVHALKIKSFEQGEWSDEKHIYRWVIKGEDGYGPIVVTQEYMDRHRPEVGGYYVLYDDDYESYSPPKAFESGYTLIES